MKELRIAILGGTGFAGRNVRNELEASGISCQAFSRTTGCDLLHLDLTWSKLDAYRPTHIVNCAARVGSVNFVAEFAADVVDINMRMLLNIYKVAQQLRDTVVINPLANCAYPDNSELCCEEQLWNGALHPSVLSFGSTRRMMQVLSGCYNAQYGVRSVNLIVPNMYGPYDSTNPNKTHALNALIIKFVRAIKACSTEVEVWGSGRPVREWLYVKDLARAIRIVVTRAYESQLSINIGQGQGVTVDELVRLICEFTGYTGRIVKNSRYPDGALKKVMSPAHFSTQFPKFEFTRLEEGIRETISFYGKLL